MKREDQRILGITVDQLLERLSNVDSSDWVQARNDPPGKFLAVTSVLATLPEGNIVEVRRRAQGTGQDPEYRIVVNDEYCSPQMSFSGREYSRVPDFVEELFGTLYG